jgi:hypothetical protein
MRDDGSTADPPIAHAKVQTLAATKRRATPALLIDMIASIYGDLSITLGTLDSVRYRECEVRHITKRMKTESKKYRTRFVRLDEPGTFYDRRSRPQSSSAAQQETAGTILSLWRWMPSLFTCQQRGVMWESAQWPVVDNFRRAFIFARVPPPAAERPSPPPKGP